MDEDYLVKATIGEIPYKTEVEYNGKIFISDEPESKGGQNFGPTPSQLLASSLATCAAITLRMYVNRKQWQVEEISVVVSFRQENNITKFIVKIEVEGNLEDTARERLLQIAKLCPIHKILTNTIEIDTQLS
ncbi:OsmC family protein [soil metagenome]